MFDYLFVVFLCPCFVLQICYSLDYVLTSHKREKRKQKISKQRSEEGFALSFTSATIFTLCTRAMKETKPWAVKPIICLQCIDKKLFNIEQNDRIIELWQNLLLDTHRMNSLLQVRLNFLPVGHTHEDIDAFFGVFSKHLKLTDVYTTEGVSRCLFIKYACSTVIIVWTILNKVTSSPFTCIHKL